MPTSLPARLTVPPPVRRLSWPETAQFLVLIVRVRVLNYRLHAVHRCVVRIGGEESGDELMRLARHWLATHEEIVAILGIEPPSQVQQVPQVQTILRASNS